MLPTGLLVNAFLSEILIIVAIVVTVFLAFRFTGLLLRAIFTFLANSILGIISIFILNGVFAMGIPFSAPVLLSTVLFGLPAVGTLVILKLGGLALL